MFRLPFGRLVFIATCEQVYWLNYFHREATDIQITDAFDLYFANILVFFSIRCDPCSPRAVCIFSFFHFKTALISNHRSVA